MFSAAPIREENGRVTGVLAFMVDPEKGNPLRTRAQALCDEHGYTPPKPPRRPIAERRRLPAPEEGEPGEPGEPEEGGDGETWWKLW